MVYLVCIIIDNHSSPRTVTYIICMIVLEVEKEVYMALRCPQCSYDNSDDSEFCLRCGNRLGQSAASSAFSPSGNAPTGSLYPQSVPSGSGSQVSSFIFVGVVPQSS